MRRGMGRRHDRGRRRHARCVENLPEHLTKHATIVLKALYDGDILDDDAILAWHAKADQENDAVKAAQAFVDFLQED